MIKRSFRKYHRLLAPILALPLIITVLTGMLATMVGPWSLNLGLTRSFFLGIHTGEILHLEGIYPMLNGLGLIGLLVTGLSMTNLFNKSKARPKSE